MLTSQKTYLGIQTSIYRDGGLYISGDPQVGSTLTANNATAVQWMADGVDISGANALTKTVLVGEVGKRITARSTSGTIETSNALTALAAVTAPTVTQPPLVVGTPTVNTPLVINAATFTGNPDKIERTIYGSAEPTSIIMARGPVASTGYTPKDTDATRSFVVVEEASNAAGNVRSVSPRSRWVPMPAIAPGPSSGLPAVPAGTTVSAFTTADQALPTGMTDNTADPFPGTTTSVTATFSSGANPPKDIRPLVAGAPVDLRGGLVSFSIKLRPSGTLSNGIANVGGFFVNLYNDSNPAAAKTNYMRGSFGGAANNEPFTGQWQTFRLPIEAFGVASGGSIADTQAYLSSIRYIGLQFVHSLANADSFQISVSDVKLIPRAINKGLVVLGFDDCRRDTFAYAYPKMKALGFPGVLYPGAIKACLDLNDSVFLNTANVLAMQADGWQTAYQAYNTESPSMSVSDFETQEIQPLRALYPTKGFNGPNDGSYFSNVNFNSVYQPVFDQYFRTMRGFRQFNDVQTPRGESLPVADPRNVRAYGVDTANNSATNGMIPYVQRVAAQKGVAIFVWHALGAGDAKIAADGGTLTGFEKLLEYLNSAEGRAAVDVVTWDEAVNRWRAGAA